MKRVKLIIVSIAFVFSSFAAIAQLKDDYGFKKNIEKTEFSNVPNLVRWDQASTLKEYRCAPESFELYSDFQRKENAATVYTDSYFDDKYNVPYSNMLLVGVLHIDGEYSSRQLLIVDKSDYSIKNSMSVAYESSVGASMQYTVNVITKNGKEKLVVTLYKFIPKSSKSVDIVEFRFTTNATIKGNILKEEYEVTDRFTLISSNLSPDMSISSEQLANKAQLWTMYDMAVIKG
ncbi:MAG: hypothetical protein K5984_05145 [Bacteroidales bacterium]|nr:hypothetical protein [Bacteroidales bacterium]